MVTSKNACAPVPCAAFRYDWWVLCDCDLRSHCCFQGCTACLDMTGAYICNSKIQKAEPGH